MSAISNQPTTRNLLSPTGFRFVLRRAPNLIYYTTQVNLPGLSLGEGSIQTPFVPITMPANVEYDTLTATFNITEDLSNYLEIWNWMIALGAPYSRDQYAELKNRDDTISDGTGVKSDITLNILTSHMNPNITVDFYDCYPINLSEILFDSTVTDIEYLSATVTFRFLRMVINT